MKPLLSIVIPTYNRYKYLIGSLDVLLSFQSPRIEIIVQDNTPDNSQIMNYLSHVKDSRLRYHHDAVVHYSQTENSELAIEKATGEYICYIGDDDALSRLVVDVVEWMSSNNIDSLLFRGAPYYWPDVEFSHGHRPSFTVEPYNGSYGTIDAMAKYRECGSSGASDINDMPRLYHGIVRADALKRAKEMAGAFFPGPSPDMASSVALAQVVKSLVKIDIPLLVDGFSYKSAGGKSLRGQHKAKLEDVEQLPVNILELWNAKIPRIWLGETIYAQSYYEASQRLGLPDIINYRQLYVAIISRHPECTSYVMSCVTQKRSSSLLAKGMLALFLRAVRYVARRLKGSIGQKKEVLSIENCTISDAELLLSETISNALRRLFEYKFDRGNNG